MCQMLARAQNFCIKCINLPTADMPVLALIGQRIWDGLPNLHAYVPIWPKGCMLPLAERCYINTFLSEMSLPIHTQEHNRCNCVTLRHLAFRMKQSNTRDPKSSSSFPATPTPI